MFENRDYISLSVSDDSVRKKSFKRQWNQLSRFQKNLLLVIICAAIVTIVVLIQGQDKLNLFRSSTPSDHIIKVNEKINIVPLKDGFPSIFPQQFQQEDDQLPIPGEWDEFDKVRPMNEGADKLITNKVKKNLDNPDKTDESNTDHDNQKKSHIRPKDIQNQIQETNTQLNFKGPTNERQRAVVAAIKHSWTGYRNFAWGHDNLKPIAQSYSDWFGLGLQIIDALDTLYIADMQEEYDEAKRWVESSLKLDINRDVNLFETTIRVLGGLLSIYHLTGEDVFLSKAIDLGNRMMPCFDSPSSIPYSDVNLESMKAHAPKWSPDSSTSEVTTIQLEFRDLSRVSNDPSYEAAAAKVSEKVHNLPKTDGLVPIFINANTGTFRNFATISLGARGDSYYEYLLKQWLQTGKKENNYLIEDYQEAIAGVIKHLRRETPNEHHVYVGELISGKDFKPKMDHLTCYLPGTLLLGYKNGMPQSHLTLANDLLETCYQIYMKQPTHLSPEIAYFNLEGESSTDIYVKANDAHNLLRPEFVESLYYFYALTGNKTYQDMGWTIFQAFEKYTKVTHGYTSIGNVKTPLNLRPKDMMETFWLGETLKYFYLLFSDDRNEIDLEKFVFNTEAHLIPIRDHS
ncbi:CLUMA_CG005170, isoform B [Clunio marinus]|uniref:alpha-1,2-Mannosidase n=1 Tax=Clunio marinus TaxID=568069 RepID=A0A1J1HU32_9DIPT|nr:CLUMA_CG005170, isoform B [Clunio marinus]